MREDARMMEDIAQSLQQEEGSGSDSDLQFWARAVRACVESHIRDAEIPIPWIRLGPEEAAATLQMLSEKWEEWTEVRPYFNTIPPMEEIPEQLRSSA